MVGRRPAVIHREAVETGFHVAPGNGVERTGGPVGEMAPEPLAVHFVRPSRPAGIGGHVIFHGLFQGGHAGGSVMPTRRIAAARDFVQHSERQNGYVRLWTTQSIDWAASHDPTNP